MSTVTPTPTENTGKRRGPRTFDGESVTLQRNLTTGVYDLAFEGRVFPIRFVAPESLSLLSDPLAAGITHSSGRHKFHLSFEQGRLVRIVNTATDTKPEEEQITLVNAVNVKVEEPLIQWIRVIVETSVLHALRSK